MKSTLLRQFRNYIEEHSLCNPADTLLLAVSGGIDSVVMCKLFHLAHYRFAIAHVNFKLRGKESDGDAEWVKKLASDLGVTFHIKSFDTTTVAKKQGVSIEMAARNLRYEWFAELAQKHQYKKIAVAHHLNDSIETVFINLLRGTGLAGLHGILPRQGNIIRPLLFASRDDIEAFAKKENLSFRKDSSNDSTRFVRNKIRHEIIPVLREINPSFIRTMSQNIERIGDAEQLVKKEIEKIIPRVVSKKENQVLINIKKLEHSGAPALLLHEILYPLGFNVSVIEDVMHSLKEAPGKLFQAPGFNLLRDRTHLIVEPCRPVMEKKHFQIKNGAVSLNDPVNLSMKVIATEGYKIPPSSHIASLDFEKLKFPLTLRKWEKGDAFHPLGMKGKKKLSDFFIDLKLSRLDKGQVWLLCSGRKIVWVLGKRIDHHYRITVNTRKIYRVELIQKTKKER